MEKLTNKQLQDALAKQKKEYYALNEAFTKIKDELAIEVEHVKRLALSNSDLSERIGIKEMQIRKLNGSIRQYEKVRPILAAVYGLSQSVAQALNECDEASSSGYSCNQTNK